MTSVLDLSQVSSFDLSKIPYPWSLVPVVGKQPYQKNWVKKECDHSEILAELEIGKATGVGLKLGNGLLAVDIDGESAGQLLLKLSGQNTLPVTTAWTSGRPGRKQCAYPDLVAPIARNRTGNSLIAHTSSSNKIECLCCTV